MSIDSHLLEEAFPGRGRELSTLLHKLRSTSVYESVAIAQSGLRVPLSYTERLAIAINEVIKGEGIVKVDDDPRVNPIWYIKRSDPSLPTLVYNVVSGQWRLEPTTDIAIFSEADIKDQS